MALSSRKFFRIRQGKQPEFSRYTSLMSATDENIYWIDGDDRILRVSPRWDEFAERNNGACAISASVCGKSLWHFIAGDVTRMWMETLFIKARLSKTMVEQPYRCDSPMERRYMQMLIIPEAERALQIQHRLLRTEMRTTPINIQSARTRSKSSFKQRCSICGRIKSEGDWLEPEKFLEAHPPKPASLEKPITVIYGVCPACLQQLSVA